jgi:hypothetical protein
MAIIKYGKLIELKVNGMAIEGSYFDTHNSIDCRKAYLPLSDPPTLRKFTFDDNPEPEPEPKKVTDSTAGGILVGNLCNLATKEMGRYCGKCHADWQGPEIPIEHRKHYALGTIHYSRLVGIEVRGGYDGVSYWQCPDCGATWNRFTGEYCPDGVE